MTPTQQIVLYQTQDGKTAFEVNLTNDNVWLSQEQMSLLFEKSRSTINEHIKNIYKESELDESTTKSKFGNSEFADKPTFLYNLDIIISVGYRVKSKRGVQFRIWATKVLKDYLLKGYSLNIKRLQNIEAQYLELQQVLTLAHRTSRTESFSTNEARGILKVLEQYAYALETLDKYDHQQLSIEEQAVEKVWELTYEDAKMQINIWKKYQKTGDLFGNEKDASLNSSLQNIYQTFDSIDLYPTIEEKAAHLLYFIVKNHSFSDGNKRIAAGLFIYFLDQNRKLIKSDGSKRIADNALVAITIMIAESKSDEKDMMIKLVVHLINHKN